MTDETTVEEQSETQKKVAPAIAKPVLLGRKIGMLQHFKEDGSVVAATVIAVESNLVTAVMTAERNGYKAVQIGFGVMKKESKMSKGERGHLGDLPPLKHLREVRVDDVTGFNSTLSLSSLSSFCTASTILEQISIANPIGF